MQLALGVEKFVLQPHLAFVNYSLKFPLSPFWKQTAYSIQLESLWCLGFDKQDNNEYDSQSDHKLTAVFSCLYAKKRSKKLGL